MNKYLVLTVLCLFSLTAMALSGADGYRYGEYDFLDSPRRVVGVMYRGGDTACDVPLGRLGTETVYFTSRGTFAGNALTNSYRPLPGALPVCFFAVRGGGAAKVLQVEAANDWPTVDSLNYLGHFPFVDMDYSDKSLPVDVSLRAFSPFILGDAIASGTPGAIFRFRISNPTDKPVETTQVFSWYIPTAKSSEKGGSATGNVDGFLVWNLGQINLEQSKTIPVFYLLASSPSEIARQAEILRKKDLVEPNFDFVAEDQQGSEATLWTIANGKTDFAVDGYGGFNWENHQRQCLQSSLSQYSFRLFYAGDEAAATGNRILAEPGNRLENLIVTGPPRKSRQGQIKIELATADKLLKIEVITELLDNPVGVVQWYRITNLSEIPINRLRLAVYANFDSDNPHSNIGTLDEKNGPLTATNWGSRKTAALGSFEYPLGGWTDAYSGSVVKLEKGEYISLSDVQHGDGEVIVQTGEDKYRVTLTSASGKNNQGWTIGAIEQPDQAIEVLEGWDPKQERERFWDCFSQGQSFTEKTFKGQATALVATVPVPAKGFRDVTFFLSWYYPDARDSAGKFVGHQYANWFDSSAAVARYMARNYADLQRRAGLWQEKIYRTDIPAWLKEQMVNSLTIMARNSAWLKDGRFTLDETSVGCPIVETMVCRFYGSIPLAWFFPELEKNTMRQFAAFQCGDVAIPFAFG